MIPTNFPYPLFLTKPWRCMALRAPPVACSFMQVCSLSPNGATNLQRRRRRRRRQRRRKRGSGGGVSAAAVAVAATRWRVTKIEYFGTYLRYLPTNPTSPYCDTFPTNPRSYPVGSQIPHDTKYSRISMFLLRNSLELVMHHTCSCST